jgi:hypothetical protein
LSFRKNANDLAGFDLLGGAPNCFARFTPVDRNGTDHPQWPLQDWFSVKFIVNNKSNRSGTGELEDDGIDPGDVIGHEQESARRKIFQPDRLYAVNQASEATAKRIESALRSGIS